MSLRSLVVNVRWDHAFPLELCQSGGAASDLSQDRRTPYYPDLDTGTSLLHTWVNDFARLPDWDTGTSLLYTWFTTWLYASTRTIHE